MREIKAYITGQKNLEQPLIPSISVIDNEFHRTNLTALLMENAEVAQPWSTIGVDQWIECGRWWLLRSQVQLEMSSRAEHEISLGGYTSLIKASWILLDIISCHPQAAFFSTTTRSEVQILSAVRYLTLASERLLLLIYCKGTEKRI